MIQRFKNNPIITPADVKPSRTDFKVMCAFNAGATTFDGKTLLLLRVAERPIQEDGYITTVFHDFDNPSESTILRLALDDPDLELDPVDIRVFTYKGLPYLSSISHLRVATSEDGRNFEVADAPAMVPDRQHEVFGIEDPRITFIDDQYYINYSAIAPNGITTCLARTTDFVTFEKLGIIFAPDNKDVAIFPDKIGGRYYCFHRPSMKQIGAPSIWLASSDNLLDWGHHRYVIGPRPGKWDDERTGCGAAPIRTDAGWLQIYHGSDHGVHYGSGAVLLDIDEPWKVIARTDEAIILAETEYEKEGITKNVVFSNGLVERNDRTVDLYYGAADTTTCGANLDLQALMKKLTPL